MFRPLHYVFRLGNRNDIKNLYLNLLEMKVLRHEEFHDGCKASCNGPYDGKWSKTMVGYGDEDSHFVIELTYNYGIGSYKPSNNLKSLRIESEKLFCKVQQQDLYKWTKDDEEIKLTTSHGYNIVVCNSNDNSGVSGVNLVCNDVKLSAEYYQTLLSPKTTTTWRNENLAEISGFNCEFPFKLILEQTQHKIIKTEASGRIAFSSTGKIGDIENRIKMSGYKILTSLVTLDTPGKASVDVVILLDADDHEICIVGDKGFRDLSVTDGQALHLLEVAMESDKSNEWFMSKKGGKPTSG